MVKVDMYIPKEPVHPYMQLRTRLLSHFHDMTEAPMCVGIWRGASTTYQEGVSVLTLLFSESNLPMLERILRQYKADAKQEAVLFTVSPITMHLL